MVALQYWDGDRDKACRLLRLWAEIEPVRRRDVWILITYRRDSSPPDEDTLELLTAKFPNTVVKKGLRSGVGHPMGCNDLWVDTMTEAAGFSQSIPYVFTTEADVIPLRRDWLNILKGEAFELQKAKKWISGHWSPKSRHNAEHVNGNMLVSTDIARLVPQIYYIPYGHAWDIWLAQFFQQGWVKGEWIYNGYDGGAKEKESDSPNKKGEWLEEEFISLQKEGYTLIHGVRGEEGEKFLKKVFDRCGVIPYLDLDSKLSR